MMGSYSSLDDAESRRTLGAIGVAVVSFAAVAGGPFGIEGAVGLGGGLPSLITLLIVAMCWACTQALMVAELSTMLPFNSGYIGWVLHGLGPRWGFVNAWICNFQQTLNIPLYAVLACNSLEQIAGELSFVAKLGVKLLVVGLVGAVNILGVKAVERVTGLMVVLVQTPFILMPILWLAKGRPFQWTALGDSVAGWQSNVAAFLSTVCWNLQGCAFRLKRPTLIDPAIRVLHISMLVPPTHLPPPHTRIPSSFS